MAAQPAALTVDDVLAAWEAGCETIHSYDVVVETRRDSYLTKTPDGGRALLEDPRVEHGKSRQVRREAERRIESIDPESGQSMTTLVWDGTILNAYSEGAKQLEIRQDIVTIATTIEEDDYEIIYRNAGHELDRIQLMRERVDTKLLPSDGSGHIILETRPKPQDNYSPFGWRVWLDQDRNFMPVKILHFIDHGEELSDFRIWENTLKEVSPGVWAPVRSKMTTFYGTDQESPVYGQRTAVCELTIDEDASSFNMPVSDDEFKLDVPVGTEVFDRVVGTHYFHGTDDASNDIKEIVAQGRLAVDDLQRREGEIAAVAAESDSGPDKRQMLLMVNVVVVVLALAFLVLRQRRQ